MSSFNVEVLDEFLEMVKEAMPPKKKDPLKATQRQELQLWQTWNTNGRKPEHLTPLYDSYKPMLRHKASTLGGLEMPSSTINAEIRKHFVNAVKTYDPSKGAQLNTWVDNHLKKASRFVKKYQNLGKIPEAQISKIREFNLAKDDLTNKFGHEPDTRSMADHLKWTHKKVVQLQTEISRKDQPVSGFLHDPAEILTSRELEAVQLLQYDTRMSSQERSVYEYTFGVNGRPRLQPGEISKRTGLHPSKVSRIRGKLKGYVRNALDVL